MMRQFRMYNSRMDLFDLSENKDFISVNPSGLGVLVENDYHVAGTNFVTKKRTMGLGELTLILVLGHMKDNAYSRYTEFVEFLNHSPYVLVYEFDGREFRRDCVLSALTKSELRRSRTLQESLKLEFTSPFYIERTEQTQPFIPIEGKAGKIYEAVKPERRIFEQLPDGGYRAGDMWHWQGEDFPGRNLLLNTTSSDEYVNSSGYPSWIDSTPAYSVFKYNKAIAGSEFFSKNKLKVGDVVTVSATVELFKTSGTFNTNDFPNTGFMSILRLMTGNWQRFGTLNKSDLVEGKLIYNLSSQYTIGQFDIDNQTMWNAVYFHLSSFPSGYGFRIIKDTFRFEKGNKVTPWSPAPEDLTNGQSSGYFIATKTNTSFDFNDFQFYNTTLETQDKTYDYIYDYTYGPELYLESYDDEFYHLAEYIYEDEEGEGNSFIIDNNSVYMGLAKSSPCEITIYGPCENPHWDLIHGTEIVQSDGYNITVPEGYRLVVSSNPQRQRAQLIGRDGTVSNVYQQQDLSKTNFVTFPVGRSKIIFFNYDRVTFRYREEYVTI